MSEFPGKLDFDPQAGPPQPPEKTRILIVSIFTGACALVGALGLLSLDLATGHYGGVGYLALVCLGLPSALFGMLGGYLWQKMRKVPRLVGLDRLALLIIALISGMVPFFILKFLSP
jgi:hypothetical protein